MSFIVAAVANLSKLRGSMLLSALAEGRTDLSMSMPIHRYPLCVHMCKFCHTPHLPLCDRPHRCFLPKIRQVLKEAHIELYTSAEVSTGMSEG